MNVNIEELKAAIDGDRSALSSAFRWKDTQQGHEYWAAQRDGYMPLDVETLRSFLPTTRMKAGEKYQSIYGEHECLFVVDDVAYCVSGKGKLAYTWDANTGKSICLNESWDIELTPKPVVENRRGMVVFKDGVADWDSWTEIE